MFALVIIISVLGAIFHAPDAYTNTANAIIAPNPISLAAAGMTYVCMHIKCIPADGSEQPPLNRDVYAN